ncbi:MAG TPA: transketolase C-terminal domain-containing protein [Streptosporangiaceae bacterium]|nr:transketolase C-terminal domain-containing protein [Streptosporangiaceae bacterium]
MSAGERVADNLNSALHALFAEDPDLILLGEDVVDPYGGAFKVTAGLSTKYPDRVLATPISENAIVGVANGLALCGHRVVAEVMFGDFATLCFDQFVNVSAKSVSMYGHPIAVPLVLRCPMGGNRGYGPTHSQSLQKHFIGVPDLHIYELSALHDNHQVMRRMLAAGRPCLFVEYKSVYAERARQPGPIDDVLAFDFADPDQVWARSAAEGGRGECLVVAGGGMVSRALGAARTLLLEHEIDVTVLTPSQTYPLMAGPVLADVARARHVFVVEESTPGGTWGSEVAHCLYQRCWGTLRHPIEVISSADSVIPAARHLERAVVVQESDIVQRIREQVTQCEA